MVAETMVHLWEATACDPDDGADGGQSGGPQLQLTSLQLQDLTLQLQPGNGAQGVLSAAAAVAALKQLRLDDCKVLDENAAEALAAALLQLPVGLEHLSICDVHMMPVADGGPGEFVQLSAGVLQPLQALTHLELCYVEILGPGTDGHALQSLEALTRLVELRLGCWEAVTTNMLSGMQHLTYLELSNEMRVEPDALAGKTQLQHLCLSQCEIVGGAAGMAQLLSCLQPLQQLTHLNVGYSLTAFEESNPPASACAALTASSKLQHLDITSCRLPAGAWQHIFPAGKQLPQLQSLNVMGVRQPSGEYAQAPEGSRLVSCCPGLQSLTLAWMQCSTDSAVAGPSAGLSELQMLCYG
jgi:hypothetical protein